MVKRNTIKAEQIEQITDQVVEQVEQVQVEEQVEVDGDEPEAETQGDQDDEDDDQAVENQVEVEDNWTADDPEDQPEVDMLVRKYRQIKTRIGDKPEIVKDKQQLILDLEVEITDLKYSINKILSEIGEDQAKGARMERMLQTMCSPIQMEPVGRKSTGPKREGGVSNAKIQEAISFARKLPAIFKLTDWQRVTGVNGNTAGGQLKRYVDCGVFTRPSAGEYQISPSFVG
jgi:hypothetical protein